MPVARPGVTANATCRSPTQRRAEALQPKRHPVRMRTRERSQLLIRHIHLCAHRTRVLSGLPPPASPCGYLWVGDAHPGRHQPRGSSSRVVNRSRDAAQQLLRRSPTRLVPPGRLELRRPRSDLRAEPQLHPPLPKVQRRLGHVCVAVLILADRVGVASGRGPSATPRASIRSSMSTFRPTEIAYSQKRFRPTAAIASAISN